MAKRPAVFCCLIGVFLFHLVSAALGQTNSWTNSASGNWEDAHWSLGFLPGTNQTILFTNAGFKVLTIGPNTVKNFPDSLTVDSLTISSPDNSANILLLSDAGLQTPLAFRQLTVGTNCMVLMSGSSLRTNGYGYGYNSIDGLFIQDGGSEVSANFFFVDGTYQLNSGNLNATLVEVSDFGRFTQSGGTNFSSLGIMDGAPEYDLQGGELDGGVTIRIGGTFNQSGGVANANQLQIDDAFVQSGGIFNGPSNSLVTIPTILLETPTNASVRQTGGTNREYEILLGIPTPVESDCTFGCYPPQGIGGKYTLANGVLTTFGTRLAANGSFQQSSGTHAISGDLNVEGSIYYVASGGPAFTGPLGVDYRDFASYTLNGGFLSANNIHLGIAGNLAQSGGAVLVASNLTLAGPMFSEAGRGFSGSYTLQDGTLAAPSILMLDGSQFQETNSSLTTSNVTIYSATFTQDGGTNEVGGGLSIQSFTVTNSINYGFSREVKTYVGSYQLSRGSLTVSNLAIADLGQFSQSGGQFTVSNIQLVHGAFLQTNGNIMQSGLLTFDNANWQSAPGIQQLGQLQLNDANSVITLPTNSCTLQFRDSSALGWSNNAILIIQNWSGSLYGGGLQQIIFGNNSTTLTSSQLSEIHFQNPAGVSAGFYPARILATGEIVPDSGGPLSMKMALTCCPTNSAMQLNLGGDIGQSYDIEVSTDLVNWVWWTNEFNSNGTICIFDCDTNAPKKFYRAHVAP